MWGEAGAMVSAQLSLFDTATVVTPTYKIGDRVKLRKKAIAASYQKKGDIVEIVAIHPRDGSIKFWNERSERWEFIYPDEVDRVIPQDEIPAKVAVTESNCQHSETDIVPPVEAVTESNCQHSEIDSVTLVEVAVTESTPELASDSVTLVEVAVTESTPKPVSDYFGAVSTYRPRGTARGKEYYRLSYKVGGKVNHVHIRGGNTDSPISQAKVAEVRSLLASGVSPARIAAMLKKPQPSL
jgi:hypothetical protein